MLDFARISYLTQAGVLFLVYLFISMVIFFTVGPFMDAFFDNYNTLEAGEATDEIAFFGPLFQLAVRIMLALFVAFPFVLFIFWVFNRRKENQYYGGMM